MSIRLGVILVFVFTVAAGFFALVRWTQDELRPRYLESLEEPLVDIAHFLAELVGTELLGSAATTERYTSEHLRAAFDRVYRRRFEARIYALDKQQVDMRVYVADANGCVVFDSDGGRAEGRDYSRWNDIHLTLAGAYGARTSHDDPLYPGKAVLYVAAPVRVNGQLAGVVSVGKPARNLDRFLAAAEHKLALAGGVATALVLVLGLALNYWITRPLERLLAYARAVKDGRRVTLPSGLGRGEIAHLGEAMEEMRVALEGREYVERYVQGLTHELKSPLAAIRACAELLGEEPPVPQRVRFIDNIQGQVARMGDLVDRLLELAALEMRHGLEVCEPVDLVVLVPQVVEDLRALAAAGDLQVEVGLTTGSRVQGDPFLIRQAIGNLLENAIAYSPAGGTIDIEGGLVEGEPPEGAAPGPGHYCLRVLDQGPGVPEYAQDKVFDRFYSLPPPSGNKGSGLGLAFVREIAELHRGRVTLTNREQGGAEACLCLPAQEPR